MEQITGEHRDAKGVNKIANDAVLKYPLASEVISKKILKNLHYTAE